MKIRISNFGCTVLGVGSFVLFSQLSLASDSNGKLDETTPSKSTSSPCDQDSTSNECKAWTERRQADRHENRRDARAEKETADNCTNAMGVFNGGSACKPDVKSAETADTLNTVFEQGATAISNTTAQAMQASAKASPDRMDKQLKETGKGQLTTGAIQTTTGLVQLITTVGLARGGDHSTNADNLNADSKALGTAIDECNASNKVLTVEGASPTVTTMLKGKDCSGNTAEDKARRAGIIRDLETKKWLADDAAAQHEETNALQNKSLISGLVTSGKNIAGGGILTQTGMQNIKAANDMQAPLANLPPGAMIAGDNTIPVQGAPNPVINNAPLEGDSEAVPLAQEEGDAPNENLIPPGGGGISNPGGLKGGVPEASKLAMAPPGTSNAGGGSGGGGPGGGQSPDAPAQPGGPESINGNGVKFGDASGGSAGGGFASSASGKRADSSTGSVDLASMLAQFLPKQESDENRKPSSILDAKKSVGPGDRDDGSILGKNANLFHRVSQSMATNFQRGNLLK